MPRGGAAALTAGERWVSFLRGYGPVSRIDGMYAETIRALADRYGIEPLRFDHPMADALFGALDPTRGALCNVVLTGTAGDGKTSLCNELWDRLGGDAGRTSGANREDYLVLPVEVDGRTVRVHFVFEFSGFAPPRGEPWPEGKLALLELFGRSAAGGAPDDVFVIAANDGKLLQAMDGLPPDGAAMALWREMERALATGTEPRGVERLLLLNLSRMSTRDLLGRALACLLARDEWRCLDDEAGDAAFGPHSPLRANLEVMRDAQFQERLLALAGLCDANGLHVSIREILLLLVNALLGSSEPDDRTQRSDERVLRPDGLRAIAAERRGHVASIYRNLFGHNLREARREQYAVFRHLGTFRVGLETTNVLDGLLVYGADDAELRADHERYVASDDPAGVRTEFERLRRAYIEAEEDRGAADDFLAALADERRRLFFRLPEDPRLDPWRLTMFQSAESYRREVLQALARAPEASPSVVRRLVCGLNRIWTGMLVGAADTLWITTGLDTSLAPVSDVLVWQVPLDPGILGDRVAVVRGGDQVPVLRVDLGRGHGVDFPLHLTRYEFLTRVADGALPDSFSKECNEDVLAFKSRLLAETLRLLRELEQGQGGRRRALRLLVQEGGGEPRPRPLGITL